MRATEAWQQRVRVQGAKRVSFIIRYMGDVGEGGEVGE